MARGGINKVVVQQARQALIARGENPSIDAIRIELGNTGSKTTIHRYLKELNGQQPVAAEVTNSASSSKRSWQSLGRHWRPRINSIRSTRPPWPPKRKSCAPPKAPCKPNSCAVPASTRRSANCRCAWRTRTSR